MAREQITVSAPSVERRLDELAKTEQNIAKAIRDMQRALMELAYKMQVVSAKMQEAVDLDCPCGEVTSEDEV